MYIRQVIVDGFKSYMNRTVIGGWDPQFNAITGLNGSGKSNILDAICFVLGISNLSQVRAGSLHELVYKQGQAGIKKASVTIVFDNRDRSGSPVGYEAYDEITVTRIVVVGGRNKYLINGHVAQQQRVQNLFHSVQLNVNNPHFLIMQGRITKVLNMKPPEILSMLEEASGTRMYQTKKEAALRTIEKKEQKCSEINQVLVHEITPRIEKLREQSQIFLKWSATTQSIERLERVLIAIRYWNISQLLMKSQMESEWDIKQRQLTEQLSSLERERNSLKSNANNDTESRRLHEKLFQCESNVESASKQLVQSTSAWELEQESLKREHIELQRLNEQFKGLSGSLGEIESGHQNEKVLFDEWSKKIEQSVYALKSAQSAELGVGEMGSRHQQRMEAEQRLSELEAKFHAWTKQKLHYENELMKYETEMKRFAKDLKRDDKEMNEAKEKIEDLTRQLNELDCSQPELKDRCVDQIKVEMVKLEKRMIQFKNAKGLQRFDFNYDRNCNGGESWNICGRIAKLFYLDKQSQFASIAIETLAGSRMYHIVVDSAATGRDLLKFGKLSQRITIIPLDRIQYSTLPQHIISKAESIAGGGDRVWSAFSLIRFDDENVAPALKYVFGTALIAADDSIAKSVTFHDDVSTKTVTLSGDIYDPRGTLTGGLSKSSSANRQIVIDLSMLREMEREFNDLQLKITQLQCRDAIVESIRFAECALQSLRSRCESNRGWIAREFLHKIQSKLENGETNQFEMNREMETIRQQIKMLDNDRSNDHNCESLKRSLETLRTQFEPLRLQFERSQLEMDTIREETTNCDELRREQERMVIEMTNHIETLRQAVVDAEMQFENAQSMHRQCNYTLSESKLNREQIERLDGEIERIKLELQNVQSRAQRARHEFDQAQSRLSAMEREHEWIEHERELFNRRGTDYDFSETSRPELEGQLEELRRNQTQLHKQLNKKVMAMLDKAESEYATLIRKRNTVQEDRRKIERVIERLDEKKNAALTKTWQQVDRDFGTIFSTLLPGARARLQPQFNDDQMNRENRDETTINRTDDSDETSSRKQKKSEKKIVKSIKSMDDDDNENVNMSITNGETLSGLAVRVGFGSVWKESLSELSGGQRSLLALSLILSLLRFKPAPMYILDEVDAALDLSHTQNIGHMLKTHFASSQFIVVSLKEGMFNHANVVFRTKFVDGSSTVTRTTNTFTSST